MTTKLRIREESRGGILLGSVNERGEVELRLHGPRGGFKTFLLLSPHTAKTLGEFLTDTTPVEGCEIN